MSAATKLFVWLFLVAGLSFQLAGATICKQGYFNCGRTCISTFEICDGVKDCPDGKDELHCPSSDKDCPQQFFCDNHCIPAEWRCDGSKECRDGKDELGCGNSTDAGNKTTGGLDCAGVQCGDGSCISSLYRCDGTPDCPDERDEENCTSVGNRTLRCRPGEWKCPHLGCLPRLKVCDGHLDCPAESEEGPHCNDTCDTLQCQHSCQRMPHGPQCLCNSGFRLVNSTECVVERCEDGARCTQNCRDTPRGPRCECETGYHLDDDGETCKVEDGSPILMCGDTIFDVKLGTIKTLGYAYPRITSSAMNLADNVIYFIDHMNFIWLTDVHSRKPRSFIFYGLKNPRDLAIDEVASNLYATDSGRKNILVCCLKGISCAEILETPKSSLYSIALYIENNLVFWTESRPAGIYQAGLDGSNVTSVVTTNLNRPVGLTLDLPSRELYWSEEGRIEAIHLMTRKRRVVVQGHIFAPTGLAVFEDKLYWSHRSVYSSDKLKGNNHKELFLLPNSKSTCPLRVYHPVLRPTRHNTCWGSPCSHICVLAPGGYRCLCPPEFDLINDKECRLKSQIPHILAAVYANSEASIYRVLPDAIGGDRVTRLPLNLGKEMVGGVAYDRRDGGRLFIALGGRILSFNMSQGLLPTMIFMGQVAVRGLAFDHISSNLVWAARGNIHAGRSDGSTRAVIAHFKNVILDLQVVPELGLIFVALRHAKMGIVSMHMDGSNFKELAYAREPISLAFHQYKERLFWSDISQNAKSIWSVDRMGTNIRREMEEVTASAIAVSNFTLFWSRNNIMRFIKFTNINGNSLRVQLGELPKNAIAQVRLLHVEGDTGRDSRPPNQGCANSNGGCSHVCLTTPAGISCVCPTTMTLNDDNKTCRDDMKRCSGFFCRVTFECLAASKRCDGLQDCPDWSDEGDCPVVECSSTQFTCRSGHQCVSNTHRCDGLEDCDDGSDERECAKSWDCGKDFDCGDRCLAWSQVCDGTQDCESGQDERNCSQCPLNHRPCRLPSGRNCLHQSYWCDGSVDCTDGVDEANCTLPECPDNSLYRCDNGICIHYNLLCDNVDDCQDNSDETNCTLKFICEEMSCPDNTTCIVKEDMCNGVNNCPDGWDERDCNLTCGEMKFSCDGSKCLPAYVVCDDAEDCLDGSDEADCGNSTQEEGCPSHKFPCGDGRCIDYQLVCNGQPDCDDYSDEDLDCHECIFYNGGCQQLCRNTPDGRQCFCRPGFVLDDNGRTCHDMDECHDHWGLCSQRCVNKVGSFTCECDPPYKLDITQHSCRVKGQQYPAPLLAVLDKSRLLLLDLIKHQLAAKILSSREPLRGLHFKTAVSREVFWTNSDSIQALNLSNNNIRVAVRGLDNPTLLQWDWVGGNFYYGTGLSKVGVCNGRGSHCATVLQTGSRPPTGLALAPDHGILFWSTSATRDYSGVISRANMDGSEPEHLVLTHLELPSSLVVDPPLQRLFWLDLRTTRLESVNFDGSDRRVSVHAAGQLPHGLAVFEDTLYWSDWSTRNLLVANKFGKQRLRIVHQHDMMAEALVVVHEVLQPRGTNHCSTATCSHICLIKPRGHTCACADGYHLDKNGECQRWGDNCKDCKRTSKWSSSEVAVGASLGCLLLALLMVAMVVYLARTRKYPLHYSFLFSKESDQEVLTVPTDSSDSRP